MRRPRRTLAVATAIVLLLAAGIAMWTNAGRRRPPAANPPPPASAEPSAQAASPSSPPTHVAKPESTDEDPSQIDPLGALSEGQGPWGLVDMDQMRAALPDNSYWTMSYPTEDPDLLRWRQEERERWNTEYGKVLANQASDEEIDAYYARREKISRDYAEFAGLLLTKYSTTIAKQDAGLLKVALELNLARLEEIPRRAAEAHQRHAAFDAARRAWLEEQKAFAGDAADAR